MTIAILLLSACVVAAVAYGLGYKRGSEAVLRGIGRYSTTPSPDELSDEQLTELLKGK